ncbi:MULTISPECIES: hypothetical protein [unclassified Polaribacter]|uniref:hypothetical protein n=1 Tax=unclassified Polaribacter TaxID=196858 RepID=UPI0011BF007C|nr:MULTISPECIES: hypothetical protein [unclassified Polaribacter]TXD53442.1 hypothetical protein ES043_04375 [Polaribacter sp. IC063]TXD61456.1 hypothetical protein ES044_04455 [Polaribacter sp. IC066]
MTTKIEISKNEFVSKFKEQVDEGSTGIFSNPFKVFSSSKNEYKGSVRLDGFTIKRRKKLFDMNINLAMASRNYKQNNENIIIETEINGFNGMIIPVLFRINHAH